MPKAVPQKRFPEINHETFLVKPLYAARRSGPSPPIAGRRPRAALPNMKSNVTFRDERIDAADNHCRQTKQNKTSQTSNGHVPRETKSALTTVTFREKHNELNIFGRRDICNLPGVCEGALAYDAVCERCDVKAFGGQSGDTGKVVVESGRKRGSFRNLSGMTDETLSARENMDSVRGAARDRTIQCVMGCPADGWLRIWPAELSNNRGFCAVLIRCVFCQVGLFTFIFFWALLGALAISMTEGPHEVAITELFKKKQQELILYLSTELRLLDKQHPKWVETVARRLDEERVLATSSVLNGARSGPGVFWDYPGAFLFVVYVLTALGFGAPVPHTWAGRSATIVFAAVGIPLHVLLVMNAGGALAWQIRSCADRGDRWRQQQSEARKISGNLLDNGKSTPELADEVDEAKSKRSWLKLKCCNFGKALKRCLSLPWSVRGMPLLVVMYYILGALVFGVARQKGSLDVVMFPLEFTTTGGLERVEAVVRILYAIYLESAVFLVSSIIYAMRSTTSDTISRFATKHDLYYRVSA